MKIKVIYPDKEKIIHISDKESKITGFKRISIKWKPVNQTIDLTVNNILNKPMEEELRNA
jgi:hypothetical protein|nr:MAG TPA: hypothetical protein [Caudoviricetes sp.]